MKIFLDTADVESIREPYNTGLIDGITTNPSLILKSGRKLVNVIDEIVKEFPDLESVSAEVVGKTSEEMLLEAEQYYTINPMVTIKLPCTPEGLKACKFLSSIGVKTNVTLIFSVSQSILASKAGATYISPFIGRIDDWASKKEDPRKLEEIGSLGVRLVEEICQVIEQYKFKTQVLAASIRSLDHIEESSMAGAHVVTTPVSYFWKMYEHELTKSGLERFEMDWKLSQDSAKDK